VQTDDPPAVKRLLRNYEQESDDVRLRRVIELARLPEGEGAAALSRIARFDRSPLVARVSALAVIRPELPDDEPIALDPETIGRELGESTRTTVQWLRQYQAQLRDPAAAIPRWQLLVDEEVARLEQKSDATSAEVVLDLLWNLADLHRRLSRQAELAETLDRMFRIESDSPDRAAANIMLWLTEHEAWEAVDDVLARHPERFTRGKRPLYMAALARKAQGKPDLAQQLAEEAARLDPQAPLENFWTAKELEIREQYDWAAREYRRAIDGQAIDAHEAVIARVSLASMMHDYALYQPAAQMLEPLVKALAADPRAAQRYAQVQRYHLARGDLALPDRESLASHFHYYVACQYHESKEWEREREELQLAIDLDATDADVLIAMYRVPESDERWRAAAIRRIRDLARDFQRQVEAAPDEPNAYNQWAWLVSNTEGDFQQAIRYSLRSLELNRSGDSAAASYLDTLGRCYYAAGDYENAVKYQRQAVEKSGYVQTMRRQLDLFEKALAEKQGAGNN
jgi:tetratricopeptide (TPR) repeat protein